MFRELREKALFGLIDGLNGAVGLVIGLLHANAAATLIFVALLARAGSSAVSMAGAQFESGQTTDNRQRMGLVAAMGLGYLTSALIPGLGFAFGLRPGVLVFIPASIAILAIITWARAHHDGWLKAAITTLVIFILAVAAGLLASLAGN